MYLEFLTGSAGSGKTYEINRRLSSENSNGAKDKRPYGVVCATTGIAAVNLGSGVTTLASELGYFDTASLQDSYAEGRLFNRLKQTAAKGKNLIIDEVSMLPEEQLTIICDALKYVNELQEVKDRGGLGLILTGDMCQLPPIKAEFCFKSRWWNNGISENVTRLTKIWRQENLSYIEALNHARRGAGDITADILANIPDIRWNNVIDTHFNGTTIVSKNDKVDRFNQVRLDELVRSGKKLVEFRSSRWGKQRSEWKLIPETLEICENAYVMILSNNPPEFSFANGDCGEILSFEGDKAIVKLRRNEKEVQIKYIVRRNMVKIHPDKIDPPKCLTKKEFEQTVEEDCNNPFLNDSVEGKYKLYLIRETRINKYTDLPYYDFLEKKWCLGEIKYLPLRLAYASTVHKSQGLSLDSVQIDYNDAFFASPAMSYVALSRCRTPGGLTIVGDKRLVEIRTNVDSEVLEWV